MADGMIIWIVLNVQGPIQAFEDRSQAEAFAQRFGGEPHFRVVSCGLILTSTING